jgi:hypothetical protein
MARYIPTHCAGAYIELQILRLYELTVATRLLMGWTVIVEMSTTNVLLRLDGPPAHDARPLTCPSALSLFCLTAVYPPGKGNRQCEKTSCRQWGFAPGVQTYCWSLATPASALEVCSPRTTSNGNALIALMREIRRVILSTASTQGCPCRNVPLLDDAAHSASERAHFGLTSPLALLTTSAVCIRLP